jgi:glycogen debranching enzyme
MLPLTPFAVVQVQVPSDRPALIFATPATEALLGEAYEHALDNLLRINVIPARAAQMRSGRVAAGASFLRAGGDYDEPWTRDASVNSWSALSLLSPELARNTLWAVCERRSDGSVEVQNDNQWWDKIIWVVAAWNHYATTGDRHFLGEAYETAARLADGLIAQRFDAEFGLFRGPSHLQDGIAGYPEPFDDKPGSSSFILDHPGSDKLMTLSVNCLYVEAFRSLAEMAAALGLAPGVCKGWSDRADELRKKINEHFWMPKKGSYAYLLFGDGGMRGKQARYQEATGISFAVLFGVADARRAKAVVRNARTSPHGIPLVDPEFARYSADKPGRHSRIVWPLAEGYWAEAAAKAGSIERFSFEVETLAKSAQSTDWDFYEIYNATTGKPDGGMQCGTHWSSCTNQSWSASAYVRMIHYGLFGMRFTADGITFSPTLPSAWGPVELKDLRYRDALLDIRLSGAGNRVERFEIDGKPSSKPFVSAKLTGAHQVEVVLAK